MNPPGTNANSQAMPNVLDFYDATKRGAPAPDYSEAEARYRSQVLTGLQLSYNVREQPQMELNEKTYSFAYLVNRQQDMAYNPPKLNPTDSRIVTGVTHEKDNTIEQIISDMNFKPKVCAYDEDNPMMVDFVQLGTALLKKSLENEMFDSKIGDFSRINVSQGNVFIMEERKKRYEARKICLNPLAPSYQRRWTTVLEVADEYCESVAIPNTAVYLSNLLESNIHKQPRIWVVMHVPRTDAEQMFREFPRWASVPVYPSSTVPPNTNGIWGDFYLQQPQKDYCEVILTESEVLNDRNVTVNGVLMYPVQYENGKITGYPLTEFSPSGLYSLVKGDNEKIPFYAYGRSVPSKNEVKEEVANEFMRIAVHKFRYSAFPSVGNLSDKVLPASIWNPAEVVPDLDGAQVKVLNPNGSLSTSDFSFYQMIMNSIDDTSVSKALEGGSDGKSQTATEYVDQKKQDLKKLGITIDGTTDFLREFYWLRLWNLIEYLDQKKTVYSVEEQKFVDAYDSLIASDGNSVAQGNVRYHMQDDVSKIDPYEEFKKQKNSLKGTRHVYVNPKQAKADFKTLKDKIYIRVVSEPDGQNQSLLGILFNLLTQYSNLRGQPIPNLNYGYIDKIIGQNSGFDIDKIFLPNQPQTQVPGQVPGTPGIPGQPGQVPNLPNLPGILTQPKPPQNSVLASHA